MAAAFRGMLRRDRERWGMTEAQAARRFGLTLNFYRQLEAGTASPSFETYSAVCELFGWPRSFTKAARVTARAPPRPGGSGSFDP
jgi:DNA-binding XRE family transcriptional regulator